MATSVTQLRIDEDLKNQATAIFEELGLDLPTAVRMFLKRTVIQNGIPFSMTLPKQEYKAARAVRAGEGRPTGKELRLQFWKEGEDDEENVIWEVLREYEVEAEEEGQKVRMYYYR